MSGSSHHATPDEQTAIKAQEPVGAYLCKDTERFADYWKRGSWNEPSREQALVCMEQAVNGWKNLAYSLARSAHYYQLQQTGVAVSETATPAFSKEVLDHLWTEATTTSRWYPSSSDPDSGPVCLIEPALLQDIVRALRSTPSAIVRGAWIPVTERMPEGHGEVLVAHPCLSNVASQMFGVAVRAESTVRKWMSDPSDDSHAQRFLDADAEGASMNKDSLPDKRLREILTLARSELQYAKECLLDHGVRSPGNFSSIEAIDLYLAAPSHVVAPEIRLNGDGSLDEIVAHNASFHLEQMDFNHWWLEVYQPQGVGVAVWLQAAGKITASTEKRTYGKDASWSSPSATATSEIGPVLDRIKKVLEAASEERYTELKDWEKLAWKWKSEGDMYGCNFHQGMAAGANWCDIFYRRIGREIDAIKKELSAATDGKAKEQK